MWPLQHLVFGYLLYSALVHLRGHTPQDYPTVALIFGTQFPDLVDKPLAWTFGILPNGRSFAHSLFTAVLLIVVLRQILRRYDRSALADAFGVGYLSHLAGDVLASALVGEYFYYYFGFLAWPLVPAIDEGGMSLAAQFPTGELTTLSTVEVGVLVFVTGLWALDGMPGLRAILTAPRRAYRRFGAGR